MDMGRTSAIWTRLLACSVIVAAPFTARAVWTDADICPWTGSECVVSTKIVVTDPEGIDLTHPYPTGTPPLTLHITSTGVLAADPSMPLTINAGGLSIDKGGALKGTVGGENGNSLTINTSGPVAILGRIDASSVVASKIGGDGGSITLASSDDCEIDGTVAANGAGSALIGGSGGEISFECAAIDVGDKAVIDASASGFVAFGGGVSLNSTVGGVTLAKHSLLRATGAGSDGGSISLSTDSENPSDDCTLSGSMLVDAKDAAKMGGSGGSVDISCGGDITLTGSSIVRLNGSDGGGMAAVFSGGDFVLGPSAAIKANGGAGSGGMVDIAAGGKATINGKVETRAGGMFENDGEISVTNGGDLTIEGKGAILNVSAGHNDQQVGQITLAAGASDGSVSPVLRIGSGASVKFDGYTGGSGGFDVDISGSTCTVVGKLTGSAKAQNGVAIGFTCDNVTFEASSLLQAGATAGAANPSGVTAGTVTIDTTGVWSGFAGPCELGGKIKLNARSAILSNPSIWSSVAPGYGGVLTASCGQGASIPSSGVIDVSAGGSQSHGGALSITTAAGTADIQGAISAKAAGGLSAGGNIGIVAPDLIFEPTRGRVEVSAESAGSIQLTTATGGTAMVSVGKTFSANGKLSGGTVIIMGCIVDIGKTGLLNADATAKMMGGWNQISAGSSLTISGKMSAKNGSNHLPSSIVPVLTGTIKPQPRYDAVRPPFCP